MDKRDFALYLGFILIVALAFSLRLYNLDERVFHHDEAAVGYFTYKLFNDGTYSYDPSFHGPFMYYVTAEMYRRMGDTVYSSRFLPALLGASMLFLLVPLRRYLGTRGMVLAAFFFALSPSFLYYSRFYREDIFISFFILLALVCAVKYAETYAERKYSFLRILYLSLAGIAFASMAALKENAYIAMALVAFFLLLLFIREKWYVGLIGRIKSRDERLLIPAAEGLFFVLVTLIVFSLFYTGDIFNFSGIRMAVEKALTHWYEMHKIERIGGPYFFYLPIIALYELPVLIFGVLGAAYYGCCDGKKEKLLTVFLSYLVAVDIMYIIADYYPALSRYLPISYVPAAIAVFLPLLVFGILSVLRSRNLFFSFLIYWTVMNLVVYSYVQEKVPWLVLNPLLPLVIIAAAYAGEIIPRLELRYLKGAVALIVLVISLSYFAYSSVLLNYYDYTNPAEPLIQAAQPPQKYSQFLDKFFRISSQYQNQSTEVQVMDTEMETQFLWYLRHYGNVKWKVNPDAELNAPLIVVHDSDGNETEADVVQRNLSSGYERLDSAKMSWYWFKASDINLDYLLYRKMDGPPGEYRFVLFYKPRIINGSAHTQQ
ncbi:MAG: TIGR03663 family protein [Candidatus Methanoperedens sp.]|nr:TIGR03663 family protein [Candidatus Methanoperedens sp.]